jgi:hypothetical protein
MNSDFTLIKINARKFFDEIAQAIYNDYRIAALANAGSHNQQHALHSVESMAKGIALALSNKTQLSKQSSGSGSSNDAIQLLRHFVKHSSSKNKNMQINWYRDTKQLQLIYSNMQVTKVLT